MLLMGNGLQLFCWVVTGERSVISQPEVAIKCRIGKLDLKRSGSTEICTGASIELYPLLQSHVDRLFKLPSHHKEPFDLAGDPG
jgi:PIN domain nuclease of toxin-antitoxin system